MQTIHDVSIGKLNVRAFLVWLISGVLVLNLVVACILADSLHRSRIQHQAWARSRSKTLAQLLEWEAFDSLHETALAVQAIKNESERREITPAGNRKTSTSPSWSELLPFLPFTELGRADANGVPEVLDKGGVGSRKSIVDQDYFLWLRETPEEKIIISKVETNRAAEPTRFVLAQRIEHADFSFAGVAFASIQAGRIQALCSKLDVGPQGTVALYARNLNPVQPDAIPKDQALNHPGEESFFHLLAWSGGRIPSERRQTQGREASSDFATKIDIRGLPLRMVVNLAEADAMAEWRAEVRRDLSGYLFFIGLSIAMGWLLMKTAARVGAKVESLERRVIEMRTLEGMVPICGHCKQIRDKKGHWNQLEAYVRDHTHAEFTHTLCPECIERTFQGTPKLSPASEPEESPVESSEDPRLLRQ